MGKDNLIPSDVVTAALNELANHSVDLTEDEMIFILGRARLAEIEHELSLGDGQTTSFEYCNQRIHAESADRKLNMSAKLIFDFHKGEEVMQLRRAMDNDEGTDNG